jgi:hypothetical protein
MNQRLQAYRKLSPADKATVVTGIVASLGTVGFVISFIASTDTVQKIHIKYKLLNLKFPKPSHMNNLVNFL